MNEDEVRGLAMAGWSLSHGFATLALTANIPELQDSDPTEVAAQIAQGVIALGELANNKSSETPDTRNPSTP